jgi:uncharacterized caspase-like protein
VVLIGSSNYRELPDLFSVRKGLGDLATLLTDPSVGAFTQQRTVVLADPEFPGEVLDAVEHAARSAEDTLLVYFAGHSLLEPGTGELRLAVSSTRAAAPHTAMSYQDVRYLLRMSPARHKVVVLDCCYAGRAVSSPLHGDAVSGGTSIEGTFVLAASAAGASAMAPAGERHTAFTGELIRVLEGGLAPDRKLISMESLYEELNQRLRAQNLPLPQCFSRGSSGRAVAIARNRAYNGR